MEDDLHVRNLNCEALKSFGYTIHVANNGKHALEIIKKNALIDKIDLEMCIADNKPVFNEYLTKNRKGKDLEQIGSEFYRVLKDRSREDHIIFRVMVNGLSEIVKNEGSFANFLKKIGEQRRPKDSSHIVSCNLAYLIYKKNKSIV